MKISILEKERAPRRFLVRKGLGRKARKGQPQLLRLVEDRDREMTIHPTRGRLKNSGDLNFTVLGEPLIDFPLQLLLVVALVKNHDLFHRLLLSLRWECAIKPIRLDYYAKKILA